MHQTDLLEARRRELLDLVERHAGGDWPPEAEERLSRLLAELAALRLAQRSAPPTGGPALPPTDDDDTLTLGQRFARAPEVEALRRRGGVVTDRVVVQLPGSALTTRAVTLTGTIAPSRQPALPMAPRRAAMRDLIPVVPTSELAVQWVVERAASPYTTVPPTGENQAKPEATTTLDILTVPLRALAVQTPVTTQQLLSVPELEQLVDQALRSQLAVAEDRQIIWGTGTGDQLLGIMATGGVTQVSAATPADLIDQIRIQAAEIAAWGGVPTGVVLHPIDAARLETAKSTTGEYISSGIVTRDAAGIMRVWGLPVVQTPAAQEAGSYPTPARYAFVADWEAATRIAERQGTSLEIGTSGDDFLRNVRRLRMEEFIGFAVLRPALVRVIQAQAPDAV